MLSHDLVIQTSRESSAPPLPRCALQTLTSSEISSDMPHSQAPRPLFRLAPLMAADRQKYQAVSTEVIFAGPNAVVGNRPAPAIRGKGIPRTGLQSHRSVCDLEKGR
jgi:hypothetical protein